MTTHEADTLAEEQTVFTLETAARVARVSVAFVLHCEREELIETQIVVGGQTGFRRSAIRTLMRIRHLHDDLGLDLEAIDMILRMHRQIVTLRNELAAMHEEFQQREDLLEVEIRNLRARLAPRSGDG